MTRWLTTLMLGCLLFFHPVPARAAVTWWGPAGAPMQEATAPAEPYIQRMADELNRLYGMNIQIMQGSVPNAAAVMGSRVLYNASFFQRLGDPNLVFGVLAHEWAHQFLHHVEQGGSTWPREIQADTYSGALLELTHRPLQPYLAMIERLSGRGSATHPDGQSRAQAVQKGYNEAETGGAVALGLPVTPGTTPAVAMQPISPLRQTVPNSFLTGSAADAAVGQQLVGSPYSPAVLLTNNSQGTISSLDAQETVYSHGQVWQTRPLHLDFSRGLAPGGSTQMSLQPPYGADRLEFVVTTVKFSTP
ncbi:MAG: M48 family metalloprotease [Candidatus Xenobia bacterium]